MCTRSFRLLAVGCAALLSTPPSTPLNAQTPPSPKAALFSGYLWGTVTASPASAKAGDVVSFVATTWNGGVGEPEFLCTQYGWKVGGTHSVRMAFSSSCFELIEYSPRASTYVGVSAGSSSITWTGDAGPMPPSYVSDSCRCQITATGYGGSCSPGVMAPIGTFRRGQTFVATVRVKPGCGSDAWSKLQLAEFRGATTVSWADTAEAVIYLARSPSDDPPRPKILSLVADGVTFDVKAVAQLVATVVDSRTNTPLANQTVAFAVDVGKLSDHAAVTDAAGQAHVQLRSDGAAGTSHVTATIPGDKATTSVNFAYVETPPPPPPDPPGPVLLRQYFAEGSTEPLFHTDILLSNPGTEDARATLRLLTAAGTTLESQWTVASRSRRTISLNDLPGLGQTAVSAVVESAVPLVADRTMTWDARGYGSHSERAVEAARTRWYLAEGATHSGFQLFYLLQNPGDTRVDATVTYLRPAPLPPIAKTYPLEPRSRTNIWVNTEGPELANAEVSADILASAPIIVERALYLDAGGLFFGAGHESAAVAEPSTRWFFAEGATGPFFDLFILLANPTAEDASVKATFLLPGGSPVEKTYTVGARSRFNIWVDTVDTRLADTAVSTVIESTNGVPLIGERAMWWPGPTPAAWHEAHNSSGATATGTRWGLAEGVQGGLNHAETYILLANTSPTAGDARVTLLFEDGGTLSRTFSLAASSRFNVSVGEEFPSATGRRFGAIVESVGATPVQLVVERAVYSDASGVWWAAGSNALATLLP